MRQAIHIFRKDVRHCWPFIAAAMALTAVNAWRSSRDLSGPSQIRNIGDLLIPFMAVLAWWLVIAAAVHGESLAGERQFWITRPYSWKSLLAAKLLFLIVFLGLLVFLCDWLILLASGFNPLTLIPGLFWHQCWLLGFLILPFAVAALTRQTREFALACLLVYVVFYVFGTVIGLHLPRNQAFPEWTLKLAWPILIAGLLLTVWQYAHRRSGLTPAVIVLLGVAAPASTALGLFPTIARAHRSTAPDGPRFQNIVMRFAPGRAQLNPADPRAHTRGLIGIPLTFSGWPANLIGCSLRGANVGRDGKWMWTFPGQINWTETPDADGRTTVLFVVDEYSRQEVIAQPADLQLSIDLTVYEALGSVNLTSYSGWSYVPGFGVVRLQDRSGRAGPPVWRTAFQSQVPQWGYTLLDPNLRVVANGTFQNISDLQATPLIFAISPVTSRPGDAALGSPVVFTAKRQLATIYRDLTISQIRLADYETKLP